MARVIIRLLARCPDQPGIVNAISRFLLDRDANIVRCDQHTSEPSGGTFYLRMEFTAGDGAGDIATLAAEFGPTVADRFGLDWRLAEAAALKRCAVLVSRTDHCLLDLLWRWQRDELGGEIVLVASNHSELREVVESFGLPFHLVPGGTDKATAELWLLELLDGACEVLVLARYMQILSGQFLAAVGVPVINIHHSFLPAFAGADPYQQARDRGVKLIGATAHYVTEVLDEGPIIEQDVVRVSHREDVAALRRLGADIERTVLARALRLHLEDRLIRHDNTVVVF